MRPKDLVPEPHIFVDGTSRRDVVQVYRFVNGTSRTDVVQVYIYIVYLWMEPLEEMWYRYILYICGWNLLKRCGPGKHALGKNVKKVFWLKT